MTTATQNVSFLFTAVMLSRFTVQQGDSGLEIVHDDCSQAVGDIEHGDTLVSTALCVATHICNREAAL